MKHAIWLSPEEIRLLANAVKLHLENLKLVVDVVDSDLADPDDVYFYRKSIERYEPLAKNLMSAFRGIDAVMAKE